MACFLVPMALAIALVPVQLVYRHKRDILQKYKLTTLSLLLWGGVVMLAVEHIAHQEVVPWFPFLTAMETPADIPVMLGEMTTIGGSMTVAIVLVWVVVILGSRKVAKVPVQSAAVTAQAAAA